MVLVVEPFTIVRATVGPDVLTLALLLRHDVFADILCALSPCLDTMPVLQVIFPVTLVACTFESGVDTKAARLVVQPVAVIDIAISMEELTIAAGLVVLPIAFIAR